MQVSTKTTVFLDGTELRDLIAQYLRDQGVLPEKTKFTMKALVTQEGVLHRVDLKETKDMRVSVEWPMQADGPKIVGSVG